LAATQRIYRTRIDIGTRNASSAAIVKFLSWITLSPARLRSFTALIAMTTTSQQDVMDAVVYSGQE